MGRSGPNHVTCPVCGYAFRASHVGTYVTVGRESDLCPKIPGRPSDGARLIRNGVTMCPACSFAAGEDFGDLYLSFDERYDVEARLEEDGLLRVFRSNSPPWLAFHAAEICGKARGFRSRELGDLCLRASWVCRCYLAIASSAMLRSRALSSTAVSPSITSTSLSTAPYNTLCPQEKQIVCPEKTVL